MSDVVEDLSSLNIATVSQPIDIAVARVVESGYEIRKQGEAILVGNAVPDAEIATIINFLQPIEYADLEGHCQERTAESIFSGVASHGYEVTSTQVDGGVIPLSYHIIAGKQLEDGSYLAFDPVFRSVVSGSAENDRNPEVQTVIFSAATESELLNQINAFYGMGFQRVEAEDNAYARHQASRETFADR